MPASLRWHQPRTVAEWEWAHEFLPEWRNFAWLLARWMLALGGPTLCGVAFWASDDFARVASGMVAFTFYPLVLLLQFKIGFWCGTRYELVVKGLRRHGGAPAFHHWKDLEAFRFSDHPELPGIRRLEFKVHRFKAWHSWSFDPAAVEESALEVILRAHLPTPVG